MGPGGKRFLVRIVAVAGGIAYGLQGTACASPVLVRDGYFEHTELGYRVERPSEGWSRISVEGADLAFQAPGGATMSMMSRCHTPLAPPRTLARHLVVGLPDRTPLGDGEVEVSGRRGWTQTYGTRVDGEPRYLKSVTVVANACIFDWVLVAKPESEAVERSFDRWWSTFFLIGKDAGEPPAAP